MLIFVMILTLLPLSVLPVQAATTYTLDIGDVEDVAQGSKADGDTLKCGTNNYFTIFFSAKARLEANSKNFSDGFAATKRLNFGSSTKIEDPIINAVQIKTSGAATVKVWWVSGGDGREVAVYNADGEIVAENPAGSVKNSLYITSLTLTDAGTYYIGNVGGNNNYYKLEVEEESSGGTTTERAPWGNVAAPVITSAVDNGDGEVEVTVKALVGHDGGDELVVTMYDAAGKKLVARNSILERDEHTIRFAPESSGKYTFKAVLKREGEPGKAAAESKKAEFVYPLANPTLTSATSKGGGKVALEWTSVKEAQKYEILVDGVVTATTENTQYTVTGLTVGQKYAFTVQAVRNKERTISNKIETTASQDEKVVWGFTHYGPSTNSEKNGYVGSLNEDGYVTVFSEGGKGKITSTTDGVAFYYTAVPTEYNFTLRAKVTVDSWSYSNGQEGFGLLVTDRVGQSGDASNFWNNQYMAGCTKIEYRYDPDLEMAFPLTGSGTKYTMKLGLGSIAKTGVTKDNLDKFNDNTIDLTTNFLCDIHTLEWSAGIWNKESGTYNIVDNCTNDVTGNIERAMETSFILEVQKNNTGYFISYYDEDGTLLAQKKYYDPNALSQIDPDYVYAGFFASRNARATFTDVTFSTILASEDAPAEEKPVTKIEPTVVITSPSVTTSLDYVLSLDSNVNGTVQITVAGQVIAEGEVVTGGVRYHKALQLKDFGENRIQIQFTPDPDQDLGPDTVLSSTNNVYTSIVVTANRGNYHRKVIYVAPDGLPNGNGSREYPFDIDAAVNNVVAGQTIVLMEGTYKLTASVKIQRGMDGTAENRIFMIADPQANSRPVLDFQSMYTGIVHGGDYWYFYGFDVTRSLNGQKGFQVSGNYNILDQIHAYHNGNTGIQLSRYSGTDLFPDWPAYNLILNCTSYGNADAGYEDADGFAAKLTVGEGNVFDGCVAYNNADDGWDLYAKVETGRIGVVTIRNCVAYANGILEDGTIGGNGNGFKLGGSSITGYHVLENSYAFFNRAKGIDSNSCPDVIVKNCISYNNGSYNVAFYTNDVANTDFTAEGIISFKDSTNPYDGALSIGENLKGKGTQDDSKYLGNSNYYWRGDSCTNASGKALTADIFVSLEFKGITRNADGTLNMQGFLELTGSAPANAGARPAGTPSGQMSIPEEDQEHNYSDAWFNEDNMFHWHECECGDRTDMGEHTLEWVIDKEATPTETGEKHQECTVCGHKKPSITIYYEEVAPTEPQPTEPTATNPPATNPTEPKPTEPIPGKPDHSGTVVIVIIVVAVLLGGGIAAAVVLRKKKNP